MITVKQRYDMKKQVSELKLQHSETDLELINWLEEMHQGLQKLGPAIREQLASAQEELNQRRANGEDI